MRKSLIMLVLVAMLATPALAFRVVDYQWLGDADYLGCNGSEMTVTVDAAYNRDDFSAGNGLLLTKQTTTGYALGYIATIWGLEEGDEVTASVWRHDDNSAMPYFALWAHYNDALELAENARGQDMSIDDGNCYGDQRLGDQTGWEEYTYTWTVETGHTGMVIDAQVYGGAGAQLYIDDLTLVVPDHASVRTPGAVHAAGGTVTAYETETWTQVKNLFD